MSQLKLPKLDKDMPLVQLDLYSPKSGKVETVYAIATPDLQRFWQIAVIKTDDGSEIAGDKVTQANIAWVPPAISSPPTQAQVEYIRDKLGAVIAALQV